MKHILTLHVLCTSCAC